MDSHLLQLYRESYLYAMKRASHINGIDSSTDEVKFDAQGSYVSGNMNSGDGNELAALDDSERNELETLRLVDILKELDPFSTDRFVFTFIVDCFKKYKLI